MLSEEDVRPARIACDPVNHDGDRRGDGFDRRPIHTLVEERGNLAEHVIANAIPRCDEKILARLEVLVEVSIVEPCPGANAAHSHCGPTALTPNLGRSLDQLLPSLCSTLSTGPTTPDLASRPHLTILTKRRAHAQTGGMRPQWWLMPPNEYPPAPEISVAIQRASR